MTALPHLHPSTEAEWTGLERVWSTITQYPPRKAKPVSSWWLVGIALVLVGLALRVGL